MQFERERKFVNIYRRHDAARELSDASFEKLLQLTQAAFELGLHSLEPPLAAESAAAVAEESPRSAVQAEAKRALRQPKHRS